ncbi:hypothetical protein MKQ70_22215 [Chitinophaga sedimenti]|uniref:hypothetical protein n=1 Tax=Chitinophaga sedimenti TaxID=2033606 RepID=UPI0020051013|nr:hypothetical protein [Chitinophaga sedimenti]MCK7557569.1 hypothetical protein [Chitinophaga sedimenti]
MQDLRFSEELSIYKKRVNRIEKLILKAIKENPDKIKLWKRGVQFLLNTGSSNLDQLFNIAEKVPLHVLSYTFLKCYLLLCIQNSFVSAINVLISERLSFWQDYKCRRFCLGVLNLDITKVKREDPPNGNFPFETETIHFFESSRQAFFTLLGEEPQDFLRNDNLSIVKEIRKLADRGHKLELNEEELWYVLNNIPEQVRKAYWIENYRSQSLSKPITWNILSLYPGEIDVVKWRQIFKSNITAKNRVHEWSLKNEAAFYSMLLKRFASLLI